MFGTSVIRSYLDLDYKGQGFANDNLASLSFFHIVPNSNFLFLKKNDARCRQWCYNLLCRDNEINWKKLSYPVYSRVIWARY